MGYGINSPCKTVYLPVFAERLTRSQYKEKTGIDLLDVFDVDTGNGETHLKPYINVVLYYNDDVGIFVTNYEIRKGQVLYGNWRFYDPYTTFNIIDRRDKTNGAMISDMEVAFEFSTPDIMFIEAREL